MWMVVQDGRPLHRGLSRQEAERHADRLARGYESHRASDKRRVAEFEVKPDTGMRQELESLYKNRHS